MSQNTTDQFKTALKNHPRLLQLTFGLMVLLSQAAPALANAGDHTAGP